MRKGFIYGTALALAMAGGGVATAKSTQASPDGEIKGTYNCQLTGGFIAQAASTGLGQFSVDGKGNVTDAAGQLAVTIGGENQPSTASSNGFFFISQYTSRRVTIRLPEACTRLAPMALERFRSSGRPAPVTPTVRSIAPKI
jgi:hypothetical protein